MALLNNQMVHLFSCLTHPESQHIPAAEVEFPFVFSGLPLTMGLNHFIDLAISYGLFSREQLREASFFFVNLILKRTCMCI